MNNEACYNRTECVESADKPKKDYLFCCCEGNMCNQNFTWEPKPTENPPIKGLYYFCIIMYKIIIYLCIVSAIPDIEEKSSVPYLLIIICCGLASLTFFILLVGLYLYKKHKNMFNEVIALIYFL